MEARLADRADVAPEELNDTGLVGVDDGEAGHRHQGNEQHEPGEYHHHDRPGVTRVRNGEHRGNGDGNRADDQDENHRQGDEPIDPECP